MKVLIVCQHFHPEQFRVNDIATSLVEKGHEVTVLTALPNYPEGKIKRDYRWGRNRTENYKGVIIKRVSVIGRGKSMLRMSINYMMFYLLGSLKAIFMKGDYDIVYAYQLSPILMVSPAIRMKKRKKIPLVVHCFDQWPESITVGGFKRSSIIYKLLYHWSRRIYMAADEILVSSKSFKHYFENTLNISASQKGLGYLPSHAESLYQDIEDKPHEGFNLLFAGNIGPAQDVESIVRAADILKANRKIMFHIVGDGLSKSKCEALANALGLTNIIFHGAHPSKDMPKYYAIADAFLLASVYNDVIDKTLPAKVQGYMAAGKPIFGCANGEVPIVIKDASCGEIVEANNFKGLADVIERNYLNKEQLAEYGDNGKQYYHTHFSKDVFIEKLESILTENINKGDHYV